MTQRRHEIDLLAAGVMLLLCLVWGLNQVAAKVANEGISPIFQAGLRSAGAGVLLWGWSAARGVKLFERDGSFWPGLLAGLLFAAEFAFIFVGLNHTTASRAVVFVYFAPFVVAIGIHLLVPSERLGLRQIVGLICAFGGIVLAFGDGFTHGAGHTLLGDGMSLIGGVLWGATTVTIRVWMPSISANKVLFYQLVVSAILLMLMSLAVGEPRFTHPSPLVWASLTWQIVIVAFATYLGWFWLITRYPAAKLSAFSFLAPLFGLVFGAVLLGEPVTPLLIAAMALVAFGIWLVSRRGGGGAAGALSAEESATAGDPRLREG
ncbi:MAG TPA: DMT family transporter [Stellaceae bacterium]